MAGIYSTQYLDQIFSHASPFAGVLPDAITAKVKAYGKGLLSPWSPQQSILNHPVRSPLC